MKKILLVLLTMGLALGMMPLGVQAGAPSDHDCFSLDGNIWCDICDLPMEHRCVSNDGNVRCDLCDALIKHDCFDYNRDGSCDLCTRPCESEAYAPGDISADGKVNMGDLSMLYAHIRGTKVLTDPGLLARCDLTGEGKVNLADAARLYAHINGTSSL